MKSVAPGIGKKSQKYKRTLKGGGLKTKNKKTRNGRKRNKPKTKKRTKLSRYIRSK